MMMMMVIIIMIVVVLRDDDDYYYDSGVETRRDGVPWKPLSTAHQTPKAKPSDKRYRNFQFKDCL